MLFLAESVCSCLLSRFSTKFEVRLQALLCLEANQSLRTSFGTPLANNLLIGRCSWFVRLKSVANDLANSHQSGSWLVVRATNGLQVSFFGSESSFFLSLS